MIIGGSKKEVISNIKTAANEGLLNAKVETNDPILTQEESDSIVYGYTKKRNTLPFKIKNLGARAAAAVITDLINKNTEIIGGEKIKNINQGAIVTCNHFNPLDNTAMRYMAKKTSGKRLFTVAQETNLAMEGFVGFFMNYADIIPISRNVHYMQREFFQIISQHIKKGDWVLIYPEQEMWFNYKKPRTARPGAYFFASKLNVPIISCYVELQETDEPDNEEFFKTKYKIRILDPIFPDPQKSQRENSRIMQEKDSMQKREIYEKIYGKKLDHTFEPSDIAGYRGKLS